MADEPGFGVTIPPQTPPPPTLFPSPTLKPASQVKAPPKPKPKPAPPVTPTQPPPTGGKGGGGLPDVVVFALILLALASTVILTAIADLFNNLTKLLWGKARLPGTPPTVNTVQVGQNLTNELGKAAANADTAVGLDLTQLAGTVSRVGRAILAAEQTMYRLALRLAPLEKATGAQKGLQQALQARVTAQQQKASRQHTQALLAQQAASQRAGHLEARLAALETYKAKVIEPELDHLRDAIPELQKGATYAWDEIKQHSELLGITGFTVATAAALSRLGANYIRCDANKALGEAMCQAGPNATRGLNGNTLRDLLELLLGAGLLLDLRAYVELEQELMAPVAEGVELLLKAT